MGMIGLKGLHQEPHEPCSTEGRFGGGSRHDVRRLGHCPVRGRQGGARRALPREPPGHFPAHDGRRDVRLLHPVRPGQRPSAAPAVPGRRSSRSPSPRARCSSSSSGCSNRLFPKTIACLVYLQVSGVGPILGSGFWLIASERFNPRSAKQSFGGITAAGTLGGLAGGLLAERVAAVLGMGRSCRCWPRSTRSAHGRSGSSPRRWTPRRRRGAWRTRLNCRRRRRARVFARSRTSRTCAIWRRSSRSARPAPRWPTTPSAPRRSRTLGGGDYAAALLRHLLRGREPGHLRRPGRR